MQVFLQQQQPQHQQQIAGFLQTLQLEITQHNLLKPQTKQHSQQLQHPQLSIISPPNLMAKLLPQSQLPQLLQLLHLTQQLANGNHQAQTQYHSQQHRHHFNLFQLVVQHCFLFLQPQKTPKQIPQQVY